jgi:hypothetical protein
MHNEPQIVEIQPWMLARIASGPENDPDRKHPCILITHFFRDIANNGAISIVFIPCRSIEGRENYNETCVLPGSEDPSKRLHPYIVEDSWVDFRRATIATLEELLTKGWNPHAKLLPEDYNGINYRAKILDGLRAGAGLKYSDGIWMAYQAATYEVPTKIELQEEVARITKILKDMEKENGRFPTMAKAFEKAGITDLSDSGQEAASDKTPANL